MRRKREARAWSGATSVTALGVAAVFLAPSCHKVTLEAPDSGHGERDGGPRLLDADRYDVAAPPADAKCGDAACAYATIGLPEPITGVYTDKGPANTSAGFRALVAFPMQNQIGLEQLVAAMYTPGGATFRKYLRPQDWRTTYGPVASDVSLVESFLRAHGMAIQRTSRDGLLVELGGTVDQFNTTFQTTLHTFSRVNPETGNAAVTVYGVTGPAIAPVDVVHAILGIVSCDLPVAASTLQPQTGTPSTSLPPDVGYFFRPSQVAGVYGVADLASEGVTGQGVTIGIISGGAYGSVDAQSFWQTFGITRADPTVVETMEPPVERIVETAVDVEWSAAMAPSASVVVYEAPDARDTSLLFTWHEAIFDARAQIISNSYSSREDSEARVVRRVYDEGGLEAAAFGLTLVASGGDEGKPDIPAASPYVTSIGGTALSFNGDSGTDFTEVAWDDSGSGITTFARPSWQAQVVTGSYRVTSDFSVDGGPGYWLNYLGKWTGAYGTSLSSPIVAGILADVQAARTKAGKPSMGYLNPILYTVTAAQQSFRDITSGGTKDFQAGVGWDAPTGWGVIRAKQLAEALP